MADDKLEGPTTAVTFLGIRVDIRVDTVRFELTLPSDKLERIGELVRLWRGRRSGWHIDFDSLYLATYFMLLRSFSRTSYSYTTCTTFRPGLDRLTTMFTSMLRHEQTFCGGSNSYRSGVALCFSGSLLLLQFMYMPMPQARSALAVYGHHTFAFSCNGQLPGLQLTLLSKVGPSGGLGSTLGRAVALFTHLLPHRQ